jgi:hypothetical protein
MAEPKIETLEVAETPAEKTSRLKSFTVNHPRTARVVGIAALTAATLGAVTVWKNRKQISEKLEEDTEDVPFDTSSKTA